MATNFYIEYKGIKAEEKTVADKVKALWKEQGNKVKDIKKTDIYFKAEEGMCYYVINETEKGFFSVEDL